MVFSTVQTVARSAAVLGLSAVATACVFGGDEATGGAEASADPTPSTDPVPLTIVEEPSEIFCDSTDKFVAEIRGAEPGESLAISSPEPIQLSTEQMEAAADAEGAYRLSWRCDPDDAGKPWELRVRGQDSGRLATILFVGDATDPALDEVLLIELLEEEFVCDNLRKPVAQLTNANEFETITFTAAGADDLVDGTTDGEGELQLTWRCQPDEAGTWELAAQGVVSGRTGQVTIVGVRPPPEPSPTVSFEEDPFLCDGGSRVFATLSGFQPNEGVSFDSPQSESILDGRADDSGNLPVRWTCGRDEADTVWQLTATGLRSRRSVTFTIDGAAAPPAADPVVTMTEDPFRCDDATRVFATITGYAPNEFIDFTSPQTENIRQGQADESGALNVRWTCGADDIDTVWDITATGAASGRAVTFQISGAAP